VKKYMKRDDSCSSAWPFLRFFVIYALHKLGSIELIVVSSETSGHASYPFVGILVRLASLLCQSKYSGQSDA